VSTFGRAVFRVDDTSLQANPNMREGDPMLPLLFAQAAQPDEVTGMVIVVVALVLVLVTIVALWKVFQKAGEPGWAVIVPIYNVVVMLRIAGRPLWWFLLFFIPIVSLIPSIMIPVDIAKRFGKGTGFGLGLAFLPFIFYPILGFGDARVEGVWTPEEKPMLRTPERYEL
jgi:hypothetical protein